MKRARENLYCLLDTAGNIITKDEEKTEVLNAFFISVFSSQTSYPQGTQTELEDKDEEQNKPPQFRKKQVVTCFSTWTVISPWMESTRWC